MFLILTSLMIWSSHDIRFWRYSFNHIWAKSLLLLGFWDLSPPPECVFCQIASLYGTLKSKKLHLEGGSWGQNIYFTEASFEMMKILSECCKLGIHGVKNSRSSLDAFFNSNLIILILFTLVINLRVLLLLN